MFRYFLCTHCSFAVTVLNTSLRSPSPAAMGCITLRYSSDVVQIGYINKDLTNTFTTNVFIMYCSFIYLFLSALLTKKCYKTMQEILTK